MTLTRRILLSLAAVYMLCGWAMAFLRDTPRVAGLLDFVLGVATMIAVYVWCRAEARRVSPRPVGRWPLWAAIFPPLLLPVFLFRTRAKGAALVAIGKGLGCYVGLLSLMLLSAFVAVMVRMS